MLLRLGWCIVIPMTDDVKIIGYAISDNFVSVDDQINDALLWMEREEPAWYLRIIQDFPEAVDIRWDGSWMDTEAMRVDGEWPMWLMDAIEMTGKVYWSDGEPYATLEVPVA